MSKGVRKDGFPAKALLNEFEEGTWANVIAERLGTNRAVIQRWRTGNVILCPYKADAYAIRLGKHPSQIWPEWFPNPPTLNKGKQQCQPTNATTAETKSSASNIAPGDTTSQQ